MPFINEFKSFALKGNVIDLAVGVIIGGAFGKIVDSVVGDLIMPLVSKAFGGLDFSNYYIGLAAQAPGQKTGRSVCLWQFHHRGAELSHTGIHHLCHGAPYEPSDRIPFTGDCGTCGGGGHARRHPAAAGDTRQPEASGSRLTNSAVAVVGALRVRSPDAGRVDA